MCQKVVSVAVSKSRKSAKCVKRLLEKNVFFYIGKCETISSELNKTTNKKHLRPRFAPWAWRPKAADQGPDHSNGSRQPSCSAGALSIDPSLSEVHPGFCLVHLHNDLVHATGQGNAWSVSKKAKTALRRCTAASVPAAIANCPRQKPPDTAVAFEGLRASTAAVASRFGAEKKRSPANRSNTPRDWK